MDKLLDSAPCGFLTFDDTGVIMASNQTLSDWLGFHVDELVGKSIETILTIASRIFYQTHWFPLLKLDSKANEIFISLLSKDQKDIPMLSNSVRVPGAIGHVNQAVLIPIYRRMKYEDEILQARRLAEQALKENKDLEALTKDLEERTREVDRQYNKMLGINRDFLQFSKIISHDLKEPIRKIALFADILSREEEKEKISGKKKTAIQKIISASARMKFLTQGLEEYMALGIETSHSAVDLNQVISEVQARIIEDRGFNDFNLVVENLPSIIGIESQINLLFYHLIDNAIKFRDLNRSLLIRITGVLVHENVYRVMEDKYKFAEHIRIIFSDNGIGMESEYKEYIFGLLKSIDVSSKGLGIGLSLIKKIVENHNGSIQVNTALGTGTEFTIILPLERQ